MANETTFDACVARLVELERLEPGWLDGEGGRINAEALENAQKLLALLAASNIPLPWIYPTECGEVEFEWQEPGTIINVTLTSSSTEISVICDEMAVVAQAVSQILPRSI